MSEYASSKTRNLHGDELLRELQHGWKNLPNKTLFALAMGGLRVRIMRSTVTMLSIVLAIAFLTYTGITNYLTQNLANIVVAMEDAPAKVTDEQVQTALATMMAAKPFESMNVEDQRRLAADMGMGEVKAFEDELQYDAPEVVRKAEQSLANATAANESIQKDEAADDLDRQAAQTRQDRAQEALDAAIARGQFLQDKIAFGKWVATGTGGNEAVQAMMLPALQTRYEQLATRLATPGRLNAQDIKDLGVIFPAVERTGATDAVATLRLAVSDEQNDRDAAELRSMMRHAGVNIEQTLEGNPMDVWLLIMAMLTCAIGIANAMLMSVTERFREIGTMKCLGAQDNLVVKLFLLESAFLGVVGAAAGIVLGLIVAIAGASLQFGSHSYTSFPVANSLLVIVMSVIGGIILSVVGAWYPAYTASRMKPVDALRVDE